MSYLALQRKAMQHETDAMTRKRLPGLPNSAQPACQHKPVSQPPPSLRQTAGAARRKPQEKPHPQTCSHGIALLGIGCGVELVHYVRTHGVAQQRGDLPPEVLQNACGHRGERAAQ